MTTRLARFLVMLGGAVVAATAMTVILAPPTQTAAILTFVLVLFAGLCLSYVVGYLGTPSDSTAYPATGPTSNPPEAMTDAAERDVAETRGAIRAGIGVAIASLFGVLLLVLFLLEETAIAESPGLTVGDIDALAVLFAFALLLVVLGLWSWRGR